MVEDLGQAGGDMHLAWSGPGTLYLRQLGQRLLDRLTNGRQGETGPLEQGRSRSTLLVEQREQHMLNIDALMALRCAWAEADWSASCNLTVIRFTSMVTHS